MREHVLLPVRSPRATPQARSASLVRAEREVGGAPAHGRAVPLSPLQVTPAETAHARDLIPSSPGAALDYPTQRAMGSRFSFDFSRVRVHSGSEAAELAAGEQARAYTVGRHVVFGAGMYAAHSTAGQALLAHELGHVAQQAAAGVLVVQRADQSNPPPTPTVDPEAVLGQRLVQDFPGGVAVAFYAPMPGQGEEARNSAQKWARQEQALAIKGGAVTAAHAVFGEPMSDHDHPLVATLQGIGKMLNAAVTKAPPSPSGPLPPGMGPTTVKTLAVFAHGTTNWCGLGSITSSTAASIIKSIAPTLAPSVNVILYSCNAGRDPDASEDWVKGTMEPGGKNSLAAVTRDALIAEGKGGSVWGHTTTGHVSENFALREFDTTGGQGSEGASFVSRYVFTGADMVATAAELLDAVRAQGFDISPNGAGTAGAVTQNEMYRCYAEANKNLTFNNANLAASAPAHPVEVGRQIKQYWTATYWPGRKSVATGALLKELQASGRAKKAKPLVTP
jgi:hypothetical protein